VGTIHHSALWWIVPTFMGSAAGEDPGTAADAGPKGFGLSGKARTALGIVALPGLGGLAELRIFPPSVRLTYFPGADSVGLNSESSGGREGDVGLRVRRW